MAKICRNCGMKFSKDPRSSYAAWERRTACNKTCSAALKVGKSQHHPIRKSLEERFWGKVIQHNADECWGWNGATHPAGYGLLGKGRSHEGLIRATHVSWKIHIGQGVPKGMIMMHTCDNPPCCNPQHLRLGTHKDNQQDSKNKGRDSKPPVLLAVDNGNGKLTDGQVRAIRQRAKAHLPPRRRGRVEFWEKLANEFGIARYYAQQLCSPKKNYRPLAQLEMF